MIGHLSTGWADNPALNEIHIQRFSELVRQTIHAALAFGGDINEFFGRSEIDGGAGGANKRVAKIVVVEETMDVGAKDAA